MNRESRIAPMMRPAWAWGRLVGPVLVIGVLVWRLGTGPFLEGLRTVNGAALAAAAGLVALTTVCSAWRWKIVAGGLGVDLSLPTAVATYYRALFLNVTLPGGIVGDVHRGVSQGREVSDVGRGLRSVAWERFAGQVVQLVLTVARSPRAAVPCAFVHAAAGGRGRSGGARRRPRGPDASGRRSVRVDPGPGRTGERHPRRTARPEVVVGHRARVYAGRRGPRGGLPARCADRGHHRPALPDAPDRLDRAVGQGRCPALVGWDPARA